MRFLADENFNNDILPGLREMLPDLDIIRVQDTEILQAPDPLVLEWAAQQNRVLLTHDVRTVTKFAIERIEAGLPMPGVIEVSGSLGIGQAIEELAVLIGAGTHEDFDNLIKYVPMH